MDGTTSYLAILAICGFLSAVWFATRISKLAGISSIVLEIAVGILLGPQILGLISDEYAVCEHRMYTNCDIPANFADLHVEGLPFGEDLDVIAQGPSCSFWQRGAEQGDGDHTYHGVDDGHDGGAHTTSEPWTGGHGSLTHRPPRTTSEPSTSEPRTGGHGSVTHTEPRTTSEPSTSEPRTGGHDGLPHEDSGHGSTTHSGDHPTQVGPKSTAHSLGPATTTTLWYQRTISDDEDDSIHPLGGNDDTDGSISRRLSVSRRLSGNGGGANYNSYQECLHKSCMAHVSLECGSAPDVFTLIGHAGVALMIFESGMHFDFEKAMAVGPKACAVAASAMVLPFVTGSLLMVIYGYPLAPDAISVGASLVPTSIGVALRLLGGAGVLALDFGQVIITAAFIGDIVSLVLFSLLFSLQGDFNIRATVLNPILCIIFTGVAMMMAFKFWPRVINEWILPKVPKGDGEAAVSRGDEVLFLIMMVLLFGYATATHFLGTHLLGCLVAGMSFACIDQPSRKGHAHRVWARQTKRITPWMIRIFFACTVAFSIPVSTFFSLSAFLKGSVMGIGPCVLTKVLCAPFMGSAKWVVGWAMVGRAEIAYLIAQMAAAANMLDDDTFSICIWALLYATVLAPFIFRTVLSRYIEAEGIECGPAMDVDDVDDESDAEQELAKGREAHGQHRSAEESATKPKGVGSSGGGPDARIENGRFGSDFVDVNKIYLDEVRINVEEESPGKRGAKDFMKEHGQPGATALGAASASPSGQQGTTSKFHFGRRNAAPVSDSKNGFLCCLFFRRIIVVE